MSLFDSFHLPAHALRVGLIQALDRPMYSPLPTSIPAIELPAVLDDALRSLTSLLEAHVLEKGIDTTQGGVTLDNLNVELEFPAFLHKWSHEFNDIVENINLILFDLSSLPKNFHSLPGSPEKRFHVLLRSFFHEFYRFREVLGLFLSQASKKGILEKNDVKAIRQLFHEAFKSIIETRNSMVHGTPTWHGRPYTLLSMLNVAYEKNIELKPRNPADPANIETCLRIVCDDTVKKLTHDSKLVANSLTKMFALFAFFHARSTEEQPV